MDVDTATTDLDIAASPDDVWEALVTNDGLADWIGQGSTIGQNEGDELDVHDAVSGEHKQGRIDEITEGERLRYTWWPASAPDQASEVTITLDPIQVGTRVTVTETRPGMAVMSRAELNSAWLWRISMLSLASTSRLAIGAR